MTKGDDQDMLSGEEGLEGEIIDEFPWRYFDQSDGGMKRQVEMASYYSAHGGILKETMSAVKRMSLLLYLGVFLILLSR